MARLLTRIVREVALTERFESYGDLKAAVLAELRRLRIRCEPREFDDAISAVASNTRLVYGSGPRTQDSRPSTPHPAPRPFSKAEAADIVRRLLALAERRGLEAAAVKAMPAAIAVHPGDVDAFRRDCGLWGTR